MTSTSRVLIVDAERPEATALHQLLTTAGHETTNANTAEGALAHLEHVGADVVLLALDLVGLHGVTRLAGAAGSAQIVLVLDPRDHPVGRQALRLGAFDLVDREANVDAYLFAIERAAGEAAMRRELAMLRARVSEAAGDALIGRSNAMSRVRELIGRAAASRMTVLVSGEPGTGKDVVARLIHDLSDRAGRPFVTVSCTNVDDVALEHELFGFAGRNGTHGRFGLFEEARGGTLVLDDISGIPQAVRQRLARVLSERSVRHAGSDAAIPVDARLILAARPQAEDSPLFIHGEETAGRFNLLPITLPPLRERRSDIPLLVQHFRARLERESMAPLEPLPGDAMSVLLGHQWPGNVRELEHWVERSAYASGAARPAGLANESGSAAATVQTDDTPTLDMLERRYILHVLDREDGHQSRAAVRLGIDRRTLYRKLKQYRDEGAEFKQAI